MWDQSKVVQEVLTNLKMGDTVTQLILKILKKSILCLGKMAVSPILAGTRTSSIKINIFGKLKCDASFVDPGPKLRVDGLLSRHWGLAQNWHFLLFSPNIGLFGPFGAMPHLKTNANEVPRGFLIFGYQSFAPCQKKLGCLAQIRPFLPHDRHFWPNIGLACRFGAMLAG